MTNDIEMIKLTAFYFLFGTCILSLIDLVNILKSTTSKKKNKK